MCRSQWPLADLLAPIAAMAAIEKATEAAMLQAVSEAVDDCPACVCAAISQAKLPMEAWSESGLDGDIAEGERRYRVNYDYKKQRDIYLAEMQAVKFYE